MSENESIAEKIYSELPEDICWDEEELAKLIGLLLGDLEINPDNVAILFDQVDQADEEELLLQLQNRSDDRYADN